MRVLVGVDESAHAETTLAFVRKMTWPQNTTFAVVSSVQLPVVAYSEPYGAATMDISPWLEVLTNLHKEVASRGAQSLASAGLQAQALTPPGDPRETLIEEAKTSRADLIVVGSHGRTGIEKLVMGSVASHIVTHAPCSVLVVRRTPS